MPRFAGIMLAATILLLPALARAQETDSTVRGPTLPGCRGFRLGAGDALGQSVFVHYTVLVQTGQVAPIQSARTAPAPEPDSTSMMSASVSDQPAAIPGSPRSIFIDAFRALARWF
jgi:hypothetical protein